MARPPRNEVAVKDFAKHVTALTKKNPGLSGRKLALHTFATTGVDLSDETCRKAVRGELDPTACDVRVLLALAAYLEVPPSALGQHAEQAMSGLLALAGTVTRPDGPGDGSDQRITQVGCYADSDATILAFPMPVELAPAA